MERRPLGEVHDRIVCPYCHHEHPDACDYPERDTFECDHCDRLFSVELQVRYSFRMRPLREEP